MTGQIACIDGAQYRLTKAHGEWAAHVRCDCLLGPHWHRVAAAATAKALREQLSKKETTR